MPANLAVVNPVAVDVGRVLDEGRWAGYQKRLVSLTALAIIFDGVDLQLFGIAVPAIMRDWHLTRADLAPVLALGYVGMILGGSVGGILGDRLGRRVAIIASMITFAVMTAAIGATNGVAALGMVRLLAGVGLGGALPNAAALASEYVPLRYRPFAVTLTIVCVPLGGTLAGLAAIPVLPALGWRALFVLGGLMPMVAAICMAPFLAESPRYLARHPRRWPELAVILRRIGHTIAPNAAFTDSRDTSNARASLATLLGPELRHDTIAVSLAFLASLLAIYTGFSWIPAMLTAAGLGATVASAGITVFNLGGVVGAVLGGLVIIRLGSRSTMLTMAAGAVGAAIAMSALNLTAVASPVPVLIMLTVLGGLINAVQTTLYALAAHVYPTSVRATGVGTVVGVGRLGALLSPYTGAWALDAGGPPAFFGVFAVAMTAAFAALAAVRRNIAPARRA